MADNNKIRVDAGGFGDTRIAYVHMGDDTWCSLDADEAEQVARALLLAVGRDIFREREQAIATLRHECEDLEASLDWPDNLHLSDGIEKHLCRPLRHRLG